MSLSLASAGEGSPGNVEALRGAMGEYAKDIKLNLGSVLTPDGAPELSQSQIYSIALASAYATKNEKIVGALLGEIGEQLDESAINAAKAAASIMAMNNVYYRFIHLAGNDDIKKMPAKLRMNIIGNPGIDKIDFELMSLAVSAINGCGMCMESHTHQLLKAECNVVAIQSAVRIAAVISATAQTDFIG
ncbi:MAG: carboxymuconolactone decarboxylase family protein [Rickettsiales bacterium]